MPALVDIGFFYVNLCTLRVDDGDHRHADGNGDGPAGGRMVSVWSTLPATHTGLLEVDSFSVER